MIGRLWHWGMREMLSHPGLAFWLITWKICSYERLLFKICNILITSLLSSFFDRDSFRELNILHVYSVFQKNWKCLILSRQSWKNLFTRCYHLNISIAKWRQEILWNFQTTAFQKALLQNIPHLNSGHVLFIKIRLKMHYIGFI